MMHTAVLIISNHLSMYVVNYLIDVVAIDIQKVLI